MHSHPGPSKQGVYNVPDLKPEAGLAEWTSKIKAMQRQVDADEEAEQKRLEEEIAASRLARSRRNQGLGYSGRASSVDMSQSNGSPPVDIDSGGTSGTMEVSTGRHNKRETNPIGFPVGRSSVGVPAPSVSLASFIGGRAAGPRLNQQLSQQDGYDASEFQRPGNSQAPHPVFGKRGVAMPGLAQHNVKVTDSERRGSETTKQNWPRSLHSPSTVNTISTETVSGGPKDYTPLVRTSAFPSSKTISSPQPSTRSVEKPSIFRHSDVQSTTTNTFIVNQDDTPSRKPSVSSVSPSKAKIQPESPRRLSDSISANLQKSSVTTNSLARPISPRTRVSPSLPQTPPSQIPSPAFLRHPLQKDPTPSISRLQGRGFVQSMVKVSTQLESPPAPSEKMPERGLTSGGRRVSVLDRWQQYDPPQTPPPTSPITRPVRRSATADPNPASPQQAQFPVQTDSNKSLKSVASSPSLRPIRPDGSVPIQTYNKKDGLGSATTLLVYKPKSIAPPSQTTDADELGFRRKMTGAIAKGGRELPALSGSPLSHLTKDRARKPRKAKHLISKTQIVASSSIQPLEVTTNIQPVLSLVLPQSPTSPLSQQFQSGTAATSISASKPPKVPSVLLQDPTQAHTAHSLPDITEGQQIPSLQADDALAPSNTDSVITTFDETDRVGGNISQQSPKHSRIPSTGKRATVMDVAQALHDQPPQQMLIAIDTIGEIDSNLVPFQQMPNRLRTTLPFTTNGEKRKSSYEKYSLLILPSLKEETSPFPSPTGTLTRVPASSQRQAFGDPSSQSSLPPQTFGTHSDFTTLQAASIAIIMNSYQPLVISNPTSQSISVEVMIITGNTAIPLSQEQSIFYDTELLAIVHRSKILETGLVSTELWVWQGKQCTLGDREEHKLHELAKRYRTTAHAVRQNSEQPDFVRVLGGRLAVRQGIRTHWTPENTTMHLVRSKGGVILIDEHDLNVRNLCSGFSYCLSILATLYVWHGRGSTFQERKAALEYAQSLEKDGSPAIELSEDGNDDDEMFWLVLGDEDFARADYWRWRKLSLITDPHIWRVDITLGNVPILPVNSFSEERETHSSVYVIDCVWELYILVGRDARSKKRDITLALNVTSELSTQVALERPYTPTVHVLLLPTQLPRDLRINLRGLNEHFLENDDMPDHMNILSSSDALTYVQSTFWDQVISQGQSMLTLDIIP